MATIEFSAMTRLLSEYTGLNLYREFKSLSHEKAGFWDPLFRLRFLSGKIQMHTFRAYFW